MGAYVRDEGAERWRELSAAREVQARPGEGGQPVGEDGDQAPGGDVLGHVALEGGGEAEPVEGRADQERAVGGDEGARGLDDDPLAAPLEFPGEQSAAREAEADSGASGEVAGVLGEARGLDERGRRYHRVALGAGERHGHHVLVERLVPAHPGVKALGHDVDQRGLDHDLGPHPRVGGEEGAEQRREHQIHRRRGGVDAEEADRDALFGVDPVDRGRELGQRRGDVGEQPRARLGEGDAAGRAVEEPRPELLLEVSDRLAEGGGRDPALDVGITLLDTADFYGMGHNELLIAEALRGRPRDELVLSVKFGALRGPDGAWIGFDGRPQAVKSACAYSLRRLGVDHIDVLRPARLDPAVPIEDTVGAIAELVAAGYVRHIGLSEVGSATLRRAAAVHPIADLQIEYSLLSRGIEADILPTCRSLGVGVTAYGVLSRGLLSGHWSAERGAPRDFRGSSPRFQGSNLDHNLALVEALRAVASARGATVAQVAIAWIAAQGADVVPLVGARRRDRLAEALGAVEITLDAADLAAIEAAVPPGAAAGTRYAAAQMMSLDSER